MSRLPRRLLGVDLGERRTGLAATDPTGTIVLPLETLLHDSPAACAAAIAEIAASRGTERIVVGLPLATDGQVGAQAARTLAFVELLRARVACEVVTCDESFTTDVAHERLRAGGIKAKRRKQLADSVAALVLLERYRAGGG